MTNAYFLNIIKYVIHLFNLIGKYIFGCFDNRDMKEKYKLSYA